MAPEQTYMICITPRSGSSMLCVSLESTGIAGAPDEFLSEAVAGKDYIPGDPASFKEYLTGVFDRHTSDNGTFGLKCSYLQFGPLYKLMRKEAVSSGRNFNSASNAFFPGIKYVYLTRRNRIEQAVSLARSMRSGIWGIRKKETIEILKDKWEKKINWLLVSYCLSNIEYQEMFWERFFRKNGIEPLRLSYEDLCSDLPGSVRRTLSFIGIEPGEELRVENCLLKQGDSLSDLYSRKYGNYYKIFRVPYYILRAFFWISIYAKTGLSGLAVKFRRFKKGGTAKPGSRPLP